MKMLWMIFALSASHVYADAPTIENVVFADGSIHVTLRHPDSGWDHYADVWRVFDPEGQKLAERVLLHPHVDEQPFTRSAAIEIPGDVPFVTVVAACTDGDVSAEYRLTLDAEPDQ